MASGDHVAAAVKGVNGSHNALGNLWGAQIPLANQPVMIRLAVNKIFRGF
jgi:hypothetical protein